MQKQIKSLFPDIKFIPVLGRETSSIKEKMGLDELLEMTLDSIKSNDKSDLFDWIKKEFRIKEEYIIKKKNYQELKKISFVIWLKNLLILMYFV